VLAGADQPGELADVAEVVQRPLVQHLAGMRFGHVPMRPLPALEAGGRATMMLGMWAVATRNENDGQVPSSAEVISGRERR